MTPKKLLRIGFHFASTSVAEREKWSLPKTEWPRFLSALKTISEECVYLTTCNRSEIYAVISETNDEQNILKVWRQFCPTASNLSPQIMWQSQAAHHLFRVAASLDSMVIGETEILGQVKEAYQIGLEMGATGPWLNRLFQQAIAQAKKVRAHTGIGKHPVSVSTVAVKLTEKIFGNLQAIQVLVLGTGEMGRQTAEYLVERGVDSFWLTNRTDQTAQDLCRQLGGEAIPFAIWKNILPKVDVLIGCASASAPLVTAPLIQQVMSQRPQRALFLIDLGVPRDVEASVGNQEGVYLYNVDDLQSIAESNKVLRQQEAEAAEAWVRHASEKVCLQISLA